MSAEDRSPYRLGNVRSVIGHYLLGRGAGAVASLASAVLLVRHMQVPDYAAYTAIMGIAGIVTMLASLGVDRVLTRFVPEGLLLQGARRLAGLVWRMLAARLLATCIVTACLGAVWAWALRWFDFVPLEAIPTPLIAFLLASATFQLLSTVLQALVRQRLLTQVTVLQWGGRLAWIVALVQQSGNIGLLQVLWIMAIPELAGAAVMVLSATAALRTAVIRSTEVQAAEPWPDWREVRFLAGHSYGFSILASVPQGYFMRTLVAATLPVETVAAYGFFSNLVDRLRMYLPMQILYNLVEPVLVARFLQSRDTGALVRNAQLIYKANVLVLASILIIVLIGGAELVEILTKGRFGEQAWILVLLLIPLIGGSHALTIQLVLNVLKANNLLSKPGLFALSGMVIFLVGAIFFDHPMIIMFGGLVYSLILNSLAVSIVRENGIPYIPPLLENAKIILIIVVVVIGLRLSLDVFSARSQFLVLGTSILGVGLFALLGIGFKVIDLREIRRLFQRIST